MTWVRIRQGRSIRTIIKDEYTEDVFHEVDNLDTRELDTAKDNYEKVFIKVRKLLENNEQYCCDSEEDRLSLTQAISDMLRKDSLIRKEK